MTLLLHRRDVTADAAEGVRSSHGAETAADLLLDFHHPQIPLGQIIVKRHGKISHKDQRFAVVLDQAVQQIFAFALFLASPQAGRGGGSWASSAKPPRPIAS
jgi:hypothetical protein